MSAGEWKAGDVGVATVPNGVEHLVFRMANGDWVCAFSGREKTPCPTQSVRAVVLHDPEDSEQAKRLSDALARYGHDGIAHVDIQFALRSLVAPPKPDEPTGLGAVVEDANQVEYIHLGSGLWAYGTTDGPSNGFAYTDIDAVKVLSKGVTQ